MKRQMIITLALALTMTMPTFAQKAMTKKEIAEKEKAFKNLQHPWKGKKVAYFGDSITDPNIKASKVKYWGFLEEWLGITPYVYGVPICNRCDPGPNCKMVFPELLCNSIQGHA